MSVSIVPKPKSVHILDGSFTVDSSTKVYCEREADDVADYLTSKLLRAPKGHTSTIVRLRLDRSIELDTEGYRLNIFPGEAVILAPSVQGLFWGVQSFLQLLPPNIYRKATIDCEPWHIPTLEIVDEPRFKWRGAHLDVARHFMPKEFVLKFIDLLALHKLNTFHWHLTEDQGWRIEIKKYPKLTQIGAWRKETMVGHYNDQAFDGKPHGGYYTQDDVREIVAYAKSRFITVIPEIEMPGHARAAIASYPELGNSGVMLEVGTKWGVIEEVYNVEDSTISFLKDVLDEVLELFPSQFIHIGGDECPKKEWKESPRAQELMKERGLNDEEELQSWFIRQIDQYLAEKGRRLVGWDEILEGGLAPGATVMSWRGEEGGIAAAKAGHDVVMTPGSHTYLDHYQGPKETEPVAIGGFTDIAKCYDYEPIPSELNEEEAKHVLGSQAQLWTEYMPNPKHVEYMAFPRLSALSEVYWTLGAKDYEEFAERLEHHLSRLDVLDVNYRRP